MSAPKKNQFNLLPPGERLDGQLQVRVRQSEKRYWKAAAQLRAKRDLDMNGELSPWVVEVLNAEAAWEHEHRKKGGGRKTA